MKSQSESQSVSEEMKTALAMAKRTLEYARADGVDGDAIQSLEAIVRRHEDGATLNQDMPPPDMSYAASKSPFLSQWCR